MAEDMGLGRWPLRKKKRPVMKRIPITAAKAIAERYGYDQVVIVARSVGNGEHVTTYGTSKVHCDIAARIGDHLKYDIMKWEKGE